MKEKTKHFSFAPVNRKNNPDDFTYYVKEIIPDTNVQTRELICDWSDKKTYMVHYRMLKFFVTHGMIVNKFHNVISFKHSMWLENVINFNTQKRNHAVNDFEKDFFKLLNNAFYGKTCENVRSRIKVEFIQKDDTDKIIKQQQKNRSMVFINHMKIMIVIQSNKMKYSWINQFF